MKKWRYMRLPNLKAAGHRLEELGVEGWELAGVDGGDGVLKRAEDMRTEYHTVPSRYTGGLPLDEFLAQQMNEGWRFAGTVRIGPRPFDELLLFEREAGCTT